ncbi:MAG: Cna B-type domain-containing protein [Clostridia bacterium]|nr:Cna B-type domain-containing protein [Clostridia bacterium]
MRTEKKRLALAFLVVLTLFICLFGSAQAADSYQLKQDTSKWAGTLYNVTSSPTVIPNFYLKDEGVEFIGIPIPSLYFSVTLEIGVECDFDLDIKQGTLQGVTENDQITRNTPGLSNEKISDNLFDYLPSLFLIGVKLESFLRIGATEPVQLKGHLKNICTAKLSTEDGLTTDLVNTVEYTSIRPKSPNKKTVFYVGTDFQESLELGEISILDIIGVGPLLKGTISFMGGGIGSAILEKDKVDLNHIPDDLGILHTCLENGKSGCLSGTWRNIWVFEADVSVHASITLLGFDIDIYSKSWPIDSYWEMSSFKDFVQSLTWGEPMKLGQRECEHIVYQVPAALWYNYGKTMSVRNWTSPVYPTENVQVDPNIRYLTSAVPNGEGKLKLYLPWKNGKYTLKTEQGELQASAEQPGNMIRGKNAQVDLILTSKAQRIFTAKKEWDIDMEDKDRPESIQVVLQRCSYNDGDILFREIMQLASKAWKSVQIVTLSPENNWTAEFSPVPLFELDEDGQQREFKYRVRELREANENEDPDSLEDAGNRVVLNRWDIDNTHLWEKLKGKVTDWNTYWQINPTEDGLKDLLKGYAKESLFPVPVVTFKVPAYTNLAGERVEEHETRYQVKYEEEEGDERESPRRSTVTITDTAFLSINIYKRWIDLADPKYDKIPDTVYIALLSRPQKAYLEHLPATVQRYAGLWLPVLKPLSGDNINLLSLVGLDALEKLDVFGLLKIPIAVAKVTKPKSGSNPLLAWRCGFVVKKYGALGIDGVPVDFEGAEVTSVVIQDLIKFLTGIDFPVSFSLQGFITVPGKAYQIPYLDKDWEKTSNIINIRASSDDDPSGDDPGAVAIGGMKRWMSDTPSNRPQNITLHIRDGSILVANLVLEQGNGFVNIKKDGNTIGIFPITDDENTWPWALRQTDVPGVTLDPEKTYTITEDPVDGYITNIDGHDITNTYVGQDWPSLLIRKVYDGHNGRPSGNLPVTLTLPYGKTMVVELLKVSNDVYERYVELHYPDVTSPTDFEKFKVEEGPPYSLGYDVIYSGPEAVKDGTRGLTYVYTITNRAPRDFYELVIQKKWVGDNENDRPDKLNVTIERDGKKYLTVPLTPIRNWSLALSNRVLRRQDGSLYDIRVWEEQPDGYTGSISREQSITSEDYVRTTITLTNKRNTEVDRVTVTGTKTWDDNNNQENTRPGKIRIHIRNSNYENIKDLEVTAVDDWKWSVANLPRKDDNGKELTYYVTEDLVEVQGSGNSGGDAGKKTYYVTTYETPAFDETSKTWTCNIKNTLPDKTTLIKVNKVWNDDNNKAGQRPESLKIRVYEQAGSNKKTLLREVELDGRSGWQASFRTEKKENAVYSVEEDRVDEYDSVIAGPFTDSGNVSFTITNTLRNRITVQKVWKDENNAWGVRPASVLVILRDSRGKTTTQILNQENEWKYEFSEKECPLWDDAGNPISYTLTEDYVPKYTGVVTGDAWNGFVVTNTPKPQIKITKKWEGDENKDTFRPASVTMHLIRKDTGADYKQIINKPSETTDNTNTWTFFVNPDICPVYDEKGSQIPYELKEEHVPNYNIGEITGNAKDGFTVTNTLMNRIKITKVWNDDDNKEGYRPESVVVKIKRKGSQEEATSFNIEKEEGWTLELAPDDYPMYDTQGNPIEYELTEETVPKYKQGIVTGDAQNGFIVTNTPKEKITIKKVWNDNDNKDNTRPQSVKINVIRDGTIRKTVELNTSNEWSDTLDPDAFPVYDESGNVISYTLTEKSTGLDEYITTITGNAKEGFTVVNTLKEQISLTKRWVDGDYSGRPEEVRIFLLRNGDHRWKEVVLYASKNWTTILNAQDYPTIGTYQLREELPNGYSSSYNRESNSIVVTNTRATMTVYVHKSWKHGTNPEHQQPDAVTIRLKNGGDVIETVVLNEENNWSHTFNDLPRLNDGGTYSVEEVNVPSGYIASIVQNGDGRTEPTSFEITNTFEKQTLDVPVIKVWNDNNSSYRPESVTIQISATNDSSKKWEAQLNADNNWSYTFTDLPVYHDQTESQKITYTVEELNPPQHYDVSVKGNQQYGFTVTNTLKEEIRIKKVWDDNNNESGERPNSVTVHLKNAGGEILRSLVLNESNDWSCTIDASTYPEAFSLTEDTVPKYRTAITGSVQDGFTVTNSLKEKIKITKVWNDNDNEKHLRPLSVTVHLKRDDDSTYDESLEITAADGWTLILDPDTYPVFDENGKPIPYTLTENDVSSDYYSVITGNAREGFVVVNTLKEQISITKRWVDGNYERRPESVTVYLQKSGESEKAEFELKKAENWTIALDASVYPAKDASGQVISYTVTEEPINGYSYAVTGNAATGFIVTNTRATMNVSVHKVWKHGANPEEQRPNSVRVQLKKGNEVIKTVTLSAANNWQYSFDNLDFLYDGSEYTVEELNVPEGYTQTVTHTGDGKTGPTAYTITNTYEKQTTEVQVNKVWEDGNSSHRPGSVKVKIKAQNNPAISYEATLTPDNNWSHTFTDLPIYYDPTESEKITYTVEELEPPVDYTVSVTGDQEQGFTITNTLKNGIKIIKVWNDDHDESGVRPPSVTVRLKNAEGITLTSRELNEDNDWSCTLDPQDYQGASSLTEDTVPKYRTVITGSVSDGFIVTNTLKDKITIKKAWNDNDDEKHLRPSSVTVHLKNTSGTVPVDEDLNLSESFGWAITLDPDKYPVLDENGQMVEYSLTENAVPQYNGIITGNAREGFVVINTPKEQISITKRWIDENYEGRPESVTVYLQRQGESETAEFELTKAENWTIKLDADTYPVRDENGRLISYTVTEKPINGYDVPVIQGDAEAGYIITNKRATMVVSAYKFWVHGTNPEDKWPTSVTIQLKKGNEVIETVILNAANKWRYTFDNLDFLQDGTVYTVEELNVPDGYTRRITHTGNGKTETTSFTITNTYVDQTRNVSVKKVWEGDDASYRPESVTVRIKAENNPEIFDEATLSEANHWSHTFTNLPVYYDQTDKQPITYKVEELDSPRYYKVSVTGDQEQGFTITNTLEKIKILVRKVWDDNNNEYNNRPEMVRITLRANGGNYASTYITPNSSGEWSVLFENVPKYENNGELAEYALIEDDIPGYTPSQTYSTPDEVTKTGIFTLTNTASTESINLNIIKKWVGDEAWKSEYRPDEVNIIITGGGKVYPVTLKASESWQKTLTGLPMYVDGKEANYLLQEYRVNGYQVSVEKSGPVEIEGGNKTFTYTLTNTLITTDIPVIKHWMDDESTHPAVTFVLYSDREKEDEDKEVGRMTLTEADADPTEPGSPWKGRFRNLPVFATDGRTIRYTLREEPVMGYGAPVILKESQQDGANMPLIYISFEVYNYPLPKTAAATVVKFWNDRDNALGIRPQKVITHLWNGDKEVVEIPLTGRDGSTGKASDLPLMDREGHKITYTLTEDTPSYYDSKIQSVEGDLFGQRYFIFFVQNTLRDDACVLTYDPNGGILEGSTEPLLEGHRKGENVLIHRAPVREGYRFLYWKGSEYHPGDEYTVTGDHLFIAEWEKEPGYDFRFSFTKKWYGGHENSIDWTLYNPDGTVAHKKFNKKELSNTEWQYEAWFESGKDYYIIETVPEGYKVRYENIGVHADVTDRCYNGGTIINYKPPKTRDNRTAPLLWIGCVLLGLLGISGTLFLRKRGKGR